MLDNFSYIKNKKTGKVEHIEVVLPQWLYCEITTKRIAKINPEYLKLKPLEKRIYHIAKRHCQNYRSSKSINLDYFAKKIGSQNKNKADFKNQIKKLTQTQPLPEYFIHLDQDKNQVYFTHRAIKSIDEQKIADNQVKEVKRKLIAKKQRQDQRQDIEAFEAGDFFSISNEEAVKHILEFIEMNFAEKKYTIFKTNILTEQKLLEYLQKFDANHLLSKIREFIDYDFTQCKNPEGYFWGILEEKSKKE